MVMSNRSQLYHFYFDNGLLHKEKPKSHSIEDDENLKELTQPTKKSKLDKEDTNWIINTALNQIKPKEKEAITRFYGIGWDFPQDMEYIGEAMNISQERVRQLIRRGEVALLNCER